MAKMSRQCRQYCGRRRNFPQSRESPVKNLRKSRKIPGEQGKLSGGTAKISQLHWVTLGGSLKPLRHCTVQDFRKALPEFRRRRRKFLRKKRRFSKILAKREYRCPMAPLPVFPLHAPEILAEEKRCRPTLPEKTRTPRPTMGNIAARWHPFRCSHCRKSLAEEKQDRSKQAPEMPACPQPMSAPRR